MATVTHAKVLAIADDGASVAVGKVVPTDWDAAHTVTLGNETVTSLTTTRGTITAAAPLYDASVTFNNGAVTFTAMKLNVTNTASAAGSLLMDFQVAGVSQLKMFANGITEVGAGFGSITGGLILYSNQTARALVSAGAFTVYTNAGTTAQVNLGDSFDIAVSRSATAGAAEINSCTQGTFRDLITRNTNTNPTTVASLSGTRKGDRSFVTDATATMTAGIGAVVVGGGANNVPVYYDGAWRIG